MYTSILGPLCNLTEWIHSFHCTTPLYWPGHFNNVLGCGHVQASPRSVEMWTSPCISLFSYCPSHTKERLIMVGSSNVAHPWHSVSQVATNLVKSIPQSFGQSFGQWILYWIHFQWVFWPHAIAHFSMIHYLCYMRRECVGSIWPWNERKLKSCNI